MGTPTANMHTKLNVPDKHPHWATTAGRVLEPAEGQKDSGWLADERAPARWMNWLQNILSEWTKTIGAAALSNWSEDGAGGSNSHRGIIYHPDLPFWCIVEDINTNVYYSTTGFNWLTAATVLAGVTLPHSIAIDSQYVLTGNSSGQVEYSSNMTAWSQIASATIGGSGSIYAIGTKYPSSDFAIVLRSNSTVRIASSGIGGSWVGATTNPTSKSAPIRVLWRGGSNWITLAGTGYTLTVLCTSDDDGDNWTQSSADPTSTSDFYDMAYCPDTGRIIIVGETTGGPGTMTIEYTDDLGVTWNVATISSDLTLTNALRSVYCCGGGLWVAVGEYTTGNVSRNVILVSKDNGTTWNQASVYPYGTNTEDILVVACDGKKMVAGGTNGETFASLTLV
jgi:hypothetical protein